MKKPLILFLAGAINSFLKGGLRWLVELRVRTPPVSETLLLQVYQSHTGKSTKGAEMLASNQWETLGDISRRTGIRGEEVVEDVRAALDAKEVHFRFIECEGVKIMQIQKKQEEIR